MLLRDHALVAHQLFQIAERDDTDAQPLGIGDRTRDGTAVLGRGPFVMLAEDEITSVDRHLAMVTILVDVAIDHAAIHGNEVADCRMVVLAFAGQIEEAGQGEVPMLAGPPTSA